MRRIFLVFGVALLLIGGLVVVVRRVMADPVDLYDGLIAFWEMDELGMQYDAHSSSEYPQMYHLTNNNTVRSGTGKILNACVFSEANGEYLSQYTADIGILPHFETGFTLSAWVWISDTATSPDMIIRRWDISGPEYLLYIENGVPRIDIYMHSGDTISATAATTVTTERWHLITAWYDDAALHIQLDNAATGSSAAPGFLNTEADSNFYISQPLSGGMEGKIDQVGMWDRPLTYAERSALWNGGYGLPYSSMDTWTPPTSTPTPIPTATPTPLPIPQDTLLDGLVSYWKLDETSGTRYDSHGSNHLTDNNSVGYTTTAILGNAAYFSASNNEQLISDSDELNFGDGDDFTISAWVRLDEHQSSTGHISIVRSGGNFEFSVMYFLPPTDKFVFRTKCGGDYHSVYHPINPNRMQYYFIIAWMDGDKGYIQIDQSPPEARNDMAICETGGVFVINGASGVYNYDLDGNIDEVGLWNRVLTPAERDALYHHTLEGLPPGTHHYGLPYADFGDYPKSAINVYVVNAQLTPVPIERIGTYYIDTFGNPATEWQESQVSAPNDWISAYGGCSNCSATELWPDWRLVPQPSRLGAAIRTYSDTQQIIQAYSPVPDNADMVLGSEHYTATSAWDTPFTRHAITFVVGTAQTIQVNTTGETPAHIGYGIWDASGLRDSGYECHDADSCEIRLYPRISDLYAGAMLYLDQDQTISSVSADPETGAQTGGSGYYYLRWPIWSGGYHTATVGISAATPTPTATPTETPTPTPESTRRPTLTPTPYTTGTPLPTTTPTPMGTATPFFTSTLTPIPTKGITTTGDITYTGPLSFSWSSTESGLNGVMIDTGSIMGSVLGEATDVINLTNQDNALWVMAALSMALLVLAWAIDTVKNPR